MAAQRTGTLPQTPTMVEAGAPEMNLSAWVGLLAPAKTPQPVIDRLQRAAHAALADPDTSGMEVAPGTGQQLKEAITQEIKIHAELVKAAGLVPQ